jgi:hypothetical protein
VLTGFAVFCWVMNIQTNSAVIGLSEFTAVQLIQLISEATVALHPEAIIVDGELECARCHERCSPSLIEEGMTVTHDVESLSPDLIQARGWDGRSSAVSEEGDWLVLECRHCFQRPGSPRPSNWSGCNDELPV